MRYGVCCSVEEAPRVLDAGFDYVEVAAAGFQGLEDDWDPSPYRGLPIEATNVFFPGSIHLFGDVSTPYIEYAQRTVERAASLGVAVMVIGSGGSRTSPDGVDRDAAFADVAAEVQKLATPYGIVVAPESLNRSETNTGNDLRRLAFLLRDRDVGYTADSYHVLYEANENLNPGTTSLLWREQIPFTPSHVHLARLAGRNAPAPEDSEILSFFRRLSELGYDARVSLECSRPAGFDYAAALRNVRSLSAL